MTDLDDLAAELEEFDAPEKKGGRPPREERIIAGLEEIQRFVERQGRSPEHGDDRDIFERIYAVRLDRLRSQADCRELLAALDHQGLLVGPVQEKAEPEDEFDDDELLAELEEGGGPTDISDLRHVRSSKEIKAAEEIANRQRCEDFEKFQPLFEMVERELKSGVRQTRPFGKEAGIQEGNYFILGGQLIYVAEVGEEFRAPNGESDARLRVIFANGTESNLLRRSLQRALYKDYSSELPGRRITDPDPGPLFRDTLEENDVETGTIYVLRSKSDHPFIAEHRELIHKIGVTGGKIETRIANAAYDATYLLAEVSVVATYKLAGINRTKMENLFHRIFAPAQLELEIQDRFGHPVRPREWFLVPLHVIEEATRRIMDGSITDYVYDPKVAQLKARS